MIVATAHPSFHRPTYASAAAPRPPQSPLFPYTTLFRSVENTPLAQVLASLEQRLAIEIDTTQLQADTHNQAAYNVTKNLPGLKLRRIRSEEHTSELQSPCNLVCRLLLEKKKHDDRRYRPPVLPSPNLCFCSRSAPPAISPLSLHDALPICREYATGSSTGIARAATGHRNRYDAATSRYA